jgi:hypothetical protein
MDTTKVFGGNTDLNQEAVFSEVRFLSPLVLSFVLEYILWKV